MLKKLTHNIKRCIPHITVRSRRKVEQDLLKNQLVIDDIGIVLWEMDFDAKTSINPKSKVIWSNEFREMLGFENEQDFPNLLGSWSARLHPEDKDYALDSLKEYMDDNSEEKPYDIEYRLLPKNGEYKHFNARGAALRDYNGAPVRMVGSLIDISDKRNLEEVVLEHKKGLEKKQIILDSLYNVGTALLTANKNTFSKIFIKSMGVLGKVIKADRVQIWRNENVGDNLHFTLSDEWLSETGNKLEFTPKCNTYPYDAVPGWEDKLRRVKHINNPIIDLLPHEYSFFNRHGVKTLLIIPLFKNEYLWGFLRVDDCQNERIFSSDEVFDVNTAGQFFAFALIFRESLDAANNEIHKNYELTHWYRSILDALPIPISVTDAEMKLTFVNSAIENMVGKKRENIYGERCSVLGTEICNTANCGIACAKRFVNRTFFKSSGKSYQVDVSKLDDLQGETAGYVEVIQDISEPAIHRELNSEGTRDSAGVMH